ncbi:SMI1/KNR4 family protein [Nocardia cyriacigeorgica]|uniref:SMI1/KNR4 family protein n=1 Tax=Nocardia cyriacigeorgica TaxID=135487 RepID=A0A5R8PIX7_9NOCA|nr:SMI1/KNR4 family protein [Nocardia cyriacigeorgica]TLG15700.1 SMI1/KNR4 family protein [Nocardia cyriacigeorgica]
MPHPAPRTFDQVWARFLHQLGMYSPASVATLQPGATAEQIAHLEAVQGFALHPDVRALLEHHNGAQYVDGNAVEGADFLPMTYMLDPIDQILAGREWRTTFSAENRASGIPEEALYGHAHQWVPIAHSIDAGILFVEHRPGPTYGHVIELGIGSGAFEGTPWADTLLEFFDTLTHSLDTRTPFHDQTPSVWKSNLTEKVYLQWDWEA